MRKIGNILLWLLSIFFFFGFITYLPSVAAVLFLIIGIGIMPIRPIRNLWNKFPLKQKFIKPLLMVILFFVAVMIAPDKSGNIQSEVAVVEKTSEVVSETVEEAISEIIASETATSETATEDINVTATTEEISETEALTATTETETEISQTEAVVTASPETVAKAENTFTIPAYSGNPYAAINNNEPFFTNEDMSFSSYEYYSPLDNKKRCGVCVASVGQDIMPTEERGEIGSVKPSGWNQAKYAGLVDGNYLYNRCHLIGFQLTGENANEKNLITGTRYLNVEGMLPFENMVADYVKETGNHVMYRVTPVFEGNNLLASGVLMEAKSVEDNGNGILFCVYCFNVQPGVTIDYSNGVSSLAGEEESKEAKSEQISNKEKEQEKPSQATSEPAVVQPAPEPEPEPQPTPETGSKYAVNAKNGKIHIVGQCSATGNGDNAMTEPVYLGTYEEAEAYSIQIAPNQNKRQCGNCW